MMKISSRSGYMLIEMIIVMVISLVWLSSQINNVTKQVDVDQAIRISKDIQGIQAAAKRYYMDYLSWPSDIDILMEKEYLPKKWSKTNVYGFGYDLTSSGGICTVSTQVIESNAQILANYLSLSVVNKDKVSSYVTLAEHSGVGLKDREGRTHGTIYQADSDGLFFGYLSSHCSDALGIVYVDAKSPPSKPVQQLKLGKAITDRSPHSFSIPVKKGDYYRSYGSCVSGRVFWQGFG